MVMEARSAEVGWSDQARWCGLTTGHDVLEQLTTIKVLQTTCSLLAYSNNTAWTVWRVLTGCLADSCIALEGGKHKQASKQ